MFPDQDVQFPIYMELTIEGHRASGLGVDGSGDRATIQGEVRDEVYSLRLHPIEEGNSTAQDVYYRGSLANGDIVGEWEHVVGMVGPWFMEPADLPPAEAMQKYVPPCPKDEVAYVDDSEGSCERGA